MNIPVIYSIRQAQEILCCGRTKIYQLVNEQKLQLVHIGRRSLVTAASVDNLLREIGAIS